jgi:hypothetical protein
VAVERHITLPVLAGLTVCRSAPTFASKSKAIHHGAFAEYCACFAWAPYKASHCIGVYELATDYESIQAIPAALPEAQFGLGPPQYSISWDAPLPATSDDPEETEGPGYPVSTPTDQISLGDPSATISWGRTFGSYR